jgi:phosphatidylglycerophosphate synthase
MSAIDHLPLVASTKETISLWQTMDKRQKRGAVMANVLTIARPVARYLLEKNQGKNPRASLPQLLGHVVLDVADKADGYIARKTGGVTPLGQELDPLMDKVDFAIREVKAHQRGRLGLGHVAIRIARDVFVTLQRSNVKAETGGKANISAGWHGKASSAARYASNTGSHLVDDVTNEILQATATSAVLASGAKNVLDLEDAFQRIDRSRIQPNSAA